MKLMSLLCLGLVFSVASVAIADDTTTKSSAKSKPEEKAKSESKAKPKSTRGPKATQRVLGKIEIADDQKEKIAAIDQQFAEELAALTKARADILTTEQKKAEKDANTANKAASKTGSEAKKAIDTALNLTDEQKAKMKEWQKSQTEFNGKVVEALKKVLTPEQQEKLPKSGESKAKKKKTPKESDAK
jgi:Spy/CpxP family protein refolding chaperone